MPLHVFVGLPTSDSFSPLLEADRLPIGSFLHAALSEASPAAIGYLDALSEGVPWAPLVLAIPVGADKDLTEMARSFTRSDHVQPVVVPTVAAAPLSPEAARAALQTRPRPDTSRLAAWIARRLKSPSQLGLIAQAMVRRSAEEPLAQDRRFRRALGKLSPMTRYEWRRLANLASYQRPMGTVDATAAALGTRPHDYRRWVKRLLGVPRAQYEALPGWEPVLELALRRSFPGSPGSIRWSRLHVTSDFGASHAPLTPPAIFP